MGGDGTPVGGSAGALVRTNVAVWAPAYGRLRGERGGALGAARMVADRAVGEPGGRWPIPAPDAARVDELVELGRRLNAVVRVAHNGPEDVDISELVVLLDGIGGCARVCAQSFLAPGVKRTKLCVGAMSAKINVHTDAETMARWLGAAAGNEMRFSVWLRDGIAAYLGEVSPRRPAEQTRRAVQTLWRIGGLFTQVGYLFDGDERVGRYLGEVEAALGDLDSRLVMCGSGRC